MPNLTDPEWLNAQYNNRILVPDHAQSFAHWAEASALARKQLAGQLDVPYGAGAGETLDIFPAAQIGASGTPVLVFVHGGYWRSLDKADHSFIAPAFVAAGATVVVPNYALCPAVSVEHIVLQMVAALVWVHRHAREFGGDPARITVIGHSAGAHLAAMLLSCRWRQVASDLPAHLVGGAMGISGLYDMEPLRLAPYLQTDLRLTAASVRRLSPAYFPRPGPKFYALVGLDESDEFLRHNQLIRDAWGPTTVPVCETLAGRNHFTILRGLAEPGARQHDLALRLLGLA